MKKQILKFSLISLPVIVGFLSWLSVHFSIMSSASGDWLLPTISFSFLYIFLSLLFVVSRESLWPKIVSLLVVLLSLFFAFGLIHVVIILFAILLLFASQRKIRNDLGQNVKLNMIKTLRLGRVFFLIAISLLVSSQYFFESQRKGSEIGSLPRVDFSGAISSSWTKGILESASPEFSKVSGQDLTIDEFVWQSYKEKRQDYLDNLSQEDQLALGSLESLERQKALEVGRKQFSDMVGRTLSGDEKVSDIFSDMINKKIANLFSPKDDVIFEGSLLPGIMALLLFLTVLSLGSLLIRMLIYMIHFLFWIMRKMGLVVISKVPVEMEVIE